MKTKDLLKAMPTKTIKELLSVLANHFFMTTDFRLRTEDSLMNELLEEGISLPFSHEELASDKSISLYLKLIRYNTIYNNEPQKINKTEACKFIAEIIDDDELFEILVLKVKEEEIQPLMQSLGSTEKYAKLEQDKVYLARKEYMTNLFNYLNAAVNLYGAISLENMLEIITNFEIKTTKNNNYQRSEGYHAKTIMFSPEFLTYNLLDILIENHDLDILRTFDSILVHKNFYNDLLVEGLSLNNYLDDWNVNENTDIIKLLRTFIDEESEAGYRELLDEAYEKPRYIPAKHQFIKYADEEYRETTFESRQLKMYIKKHYNSPLKKIAEEAGLTTDIILDGLIDELRDMLSDRNTYQEQEQNNDHDFIAEIFDLFNDHDIYFEDNDETNQMLNYIMQTRNAEKLWINNGYSPKELMAFLPKSDKLTIVPGSTDMAELLKENIGLLPDNVNIDFDINATNIPTALYPKGIKNDAEKINTRKIYPNDPCLCGSNKKFKKCCGRNT